MRLLILFVSLVAQPVLAFEYLLSFEQVCAYEKRTFQCKSSSQTAILRQQADGKWVGVNPNGGAVEMIVMKHNDSVLVLENPVLFSGGSVIHLMKKTGRFYWSEFAYSEYLKADEGVVRVGRMELRSRR